MEDRARYVLIGLFTFVVAIGAFVFVFWMQSGSDGQDATRYRVVFSGSVTGLHVGAPVLFNGIRVGGVTDLRLNDNPGQVVAVLAVKKLTPIREDTRVTLEFAGLTGIASVSLKGMLNSSPPLKGKNGQLPTLQADTSAGQDLSSSVRDSLSKVNALVEQNQESIHKTIKNLETFTDTLARNSDKIDKLMSSSNRAMDSMGTFADNLDKRTALITRDVHKVAETADKQIDNVGNQATKSISNIDKAVTDLAKHPQRIIFGGGN